MRAREEHPPHSGSPAPEADGAHPSTERDPDETTSGTAPRRRGLSRRTFVLAPVAALGATAAGALLWRRLEGFQRAATVVARATAYDGRLEGILREALLALGWDRRRFAGKTVLLKPNLVEAAAGVVHVNTHPVFVRALVEVLRRWDAREVLVGEGTAHYRDTHLVLEASGMDAALREDRIPFMDLNFDEAIPVPNRGGFTPLAELYLPRTLRRCDLVVSLPKLKTHHWAGVTLSLKNLFGVMPGAVYGWPKNVLHQAGISRAILDIHAAVRPHLALVDGVVGMEGDGPLLGTPRAAGLVVAGDNLVAVDATAVRLMGHDPARVDYLAVAAGRFGPIRAAHIAQRGEPLAGLVQTFRLVNNPLSTPT